MKTLSFILLILALSFSSKSQSCFELVQEIIKDKSPVLYNKNLNPTLHNLVNHIFPSSNHYDLDEILEIERFNDFLIENEIVWDDDLLIIKKKSIIQIYLESEITKLTHLNSEHFDLLQRNSLRNSLKGHGLKNIQNDPYHSLRDLSQKNLVRIQNKIIHKEISLSKNIEIFINSIELRPIHNTHVIKGESQFPILSSDYLEKILGKGGFNTDAFNREIMQSDDNIFFFANLVNNKTSYDPYDKRYGKNKLTIKRDLMLNRGWVSLFVMYPEELNYFGQKLRDPTVPLDLDYHEKLLHYKGLLYRYDFTPTDYESLVKISLKNWVHKVRVENPGFYQRLDKNPSKLIEKVETALEFTLGFKAKFEFKIPTLIQRKDLISI